MSYRYCPQCAAELEHREIGGALRQACPACDFVFWNNPTPVVAVTVERFIQSALREWAYRWTYQNSVERTQALVSWQHHYNWHRPHSGIGGLPPMSRLPATGNNVLTLHT